MKPASKQSYCRAGLRLLVAGGVIVFLAVNWTVWGRSRNPEAEARQTLVMASCALVALVALLPVLRRGNQWQAAIGGMLLAIPALVLFNVVWELFLAKG